MNQTQASRLLTLAHFLKTQVDKEEFDMDSYGRVVADERGDLASEIVLGEPIKVPTVTCNTSACALGWATSVFPQKFRMRWDGDLSELVQDGDIVVGQVEVKVDGEWDEVDYGFEVVHDFFGITDDEATQLFQADCNQSEWDEESDSFTKVIKTTPKMKAAQIEKLVASKGWTYAK